MSQILNRFNIFEYLLAKNIKFNRFFFKAKLIFCCICSSTNWNRNFIWKIQTQSHVFSLSSYFKTIWKWNWNFLTLNFPNCNYACNRLFYLKSVSLSFKVLFTENEGNTDSGNFTTAFFRFRQSKFYRNV